MIVAPPGHNYAFFICPSCFPVAASKAGLPYFVSSSFHTSASYVGYRGYHVGMKLRSVPLMCITSRSKVSIGT